MKTLHFKLLIASLLLVVVSINAQTNKSKSSQKETIKKEKITTKSTNVVRPNTSISQPSTVEHQGIKQKHIVTKKLPSNSASMKSTDNKKATINKKNSQAILANSSSSDERNINKKHKITDPALLKSRKLEKEKAGTQKKNSTVKYKVAGQK